MARRKKPVDAPNGDAHQTFRRAIAASPEDNLAQLVYADWLEEHGHPGAEFLRLQCALDGLSRWDEGWREMTARERQLYEALDAGWRDPTDEVLAQVLAARWAACVACPDCVADPECRERARRCLRSLMRRASWNVELLLRRLRASGYRFSPYVDAYSPPTRATLRVLRQFEQEGLGYLPLSVRTWAEEVGGVSLSGYHPDWPFRSHSEDEDAGRPFLYTNPLEVDVVGAIENYEGQVLWIANDLVQKAAESGHVLEIAVAEPALEAVVEGHGAGVPFLEYVREAFRRGGFSGLGDSQCWGHTRRMPAAESPDAIARIRAELCQGLRPF
jgi:uncharacterized protein (TIGR02996 family)